MVFLGNWGVNSFHYSRYWKPPFPITEVGNNHTVQSFPAFITFLGKKGNFEKLRGFERAIEAAEFDENLKENV